jgi:copper chaperone CopZ
MKRFTLELPTLYGDHHVIEVRRLLLEMPGVEDVYASSAFHVVEVDYDPDKISEANIQGKLEEAGYLGELTFPVESGTAAYQQVNGVTYFRHTMVYENTRQVVSFAQTVQDTGRPLWPCPGIGVVKKVEE